MKILDFMDKVSEQSRYDLADDILKNSSWVVKDPDREVTKIDIYGANYVSQHIIDLTDAMAQMFRAMVREPSELLIEFGEADKLTLPFTDERIDPMYGELSNFACGTYNQRSSECNKLSACIVDVTSAANESNTILNVALALGELLSYSHSRENESISEIRYVRSLVACYYALELLKAIGDMEDYILLTKCFAWADEDEFIDFLDNTDITVNDKIHGILETIVALSSLERIGLTDIEYSDRFSKEFIFEITNLMNAWKKVCTKVIENNTMIEDNDVAEIESIADKIKSLLI